VWAGIETASPRAGTLVAASFVENHLEHLIRSRMKDDKKLLDKMLTSSGVLGTFSAKINIGYLMNIYSESTWKELDTIRDIRNDFAHELDISYDTQSIKDRCANLVQWQKWEITFTAVKEADSVEGEKPSLTLDFTVGNPTTPYGRYQSACRYYIAVLSLLTNHPHQLEI
jgi:hypothetical protein